MSCTMPANASAEIHVPCILAVQWLAVCTFESSYFPCSSSHFVTFLFFCCCCCSPCSCLLLFTIHLWSELESLTKRNPSSKTSSGAHHSICIDFCTEIASRLHWCVKHGKAAIFVCHQNSGVTKPQPVGESV